MRSSKVYDIKVRLLTLALEPDRTERTKCVVGALERWLKAAKESFDCEGNQGEKALASKG